MAGCALALSGCVAQRSSGPLLSAPPSAAADDDIYISDDEGRIRALRPDGTEQWTLSLREEVARLDAAASGDLRVDYLVARSGGRLFGLATWLTGHDAGRTVIFGTEGGRLLWRVGVPYPEQNGAP